MQRLKKFDNYNDEDRFEKIIKEFTEEAPQNLKRKKNSFEND